jgi:hypothetical protein
MTLRALICLHLMFPLALCAATAKLPVIKDTGITTERGHLSDNGGASVSVPIRQNQNWYGFETKAWLAQFDTAPVKGWTVSRAWLNVFLARGDLYGIGVCTVLGDWEEGQGLNGQTGQGGASWLWAREPRQGQKPGAENYWSWPGSGIYSVAWAHPDLRYFHAGPETIERERLEGGRIVHLRFPVDPSQVEALAAGLSTGLVLTDDKGQVAEGLSLNGSAVPYVYELSQDIYLFTREIQDPKLRPYLEVEGEAVDRIAPGGVGQFAVAGTEPFDPSVTVAFTAPAEDGGLGGPALGYEARVSPEAIGEAGWEKAQRLPLWEVPKPAAPGTRQEMRVFSLAPGSYHLALRALDEAGNAGPLSECEIVIPEVPQVPFAGKAPQTGAGATAEVVFEDLLELWACPDLCKVDPVSGGVLQDGENYEPAGKYKSENQVWSGAKRTVSLEAARGEVVAFQVLLGRRGAGKLSGLRVSLSNFSGNPGEIKVQNNVSTYRVWYLDVEPRPEELTGPWEMIVDKGHKAAWHGDACLPLEEQFGTSFSLPSADNMGDDQRWQSVWVDLYVPEGTKPGLYQGKVTVTADQLKRPAFLVVMLKVLPFSVPARITWPIDLNAYGYGLDQVSGVSLEKEPQRYLALERQFYQLGHQHRSTLNILPYSQGGLVPPKSAPTLKGSGRNIGVDSWKEWDARFGQYLDGKAFTPGLGYRGPGAGIPVTHMYLPFFENWPLPIEKHYGDWKDLRTREEFVEWAKTSRPLEVAFDKDYQEGFASVVRQFFEHFDKKGYYSTNFQVYFNNKYYYKVNLFSVRAEGRGTSFWLLDEPVDYDDYAANRFFMLLTKKGYDQARTPRIPIDYRTDISQPELTRGLWDGVCNNWDDSGLVDFATTAGFRMRRMPEERSWRYGGAPRISGRLIDLQHTFLTLWAIGAAGALPYWNVLGGGDWFKPDDLSIYYTGRNYARTQKTFDGAFASVRLKAIRRAQQDIEYLNLLAAKKGWNRLKLRQALARFADDPKAPVLRFDNLSNESLYEIRRAVAAALAE